MYGNTSRVIAVVHQEVYGETVYRMAETLGLEGIVAKPLSNPYCSGYASGWLKIKTAHGRATDAERRKWNER